MTQEYIPSDEVVKLKFAGLEIPELIRATRAEKLYGIDAREKLFERWLADHDAQIREDALKFTDIELQILESVFDVSIEEDEGDGLGAMSAGLKAVIKYRKEHQQ